MLLHGFPSAGHMFRDLIPLLADPFHIVAPDLPGFGQSGMPPRSRSITRSRSSRGVIDRFTEIGGPEAFRSLYLRLRRADRLPARDRHPERITAIISQNGNAYEEGLSDGWNPIRAYWECRHRPTGRRSEAS